MGTVVNKADFSGFVTSSFVEGKSVVLEISQHVNDRFPTVFHLLIPNPIVNKIAEKCINIGDKVLITNALMYQKDGVFRYRITNPEQLQVLESERNHNLGTITAREKFI